MLVGCCRTLLFCLFVKTSYLKHCILQEHIISKEEKTGTAAEGSIKWSVAVSRLFSLSFFCTTKQVRVCLMSFFLLESCSHITELISVNTSSPADIIYLL